MTSQAFWKAIIARLVAVVVPSGGTAVGSTGTWSTKAAMPPARFGLGVGLVNGILYAVGGFNGTNDVNIVEAYDPSTNTMRSSRQATIAPTSGPLW